MKKFILTFVVVFFFTQSNAQFWQQTNGPEGGKVSAFAVNRTSGDLFISFAFPYLFGNNGASGKVFRSSDNGNSWQPADNGILRFQAIEFAFEPGVPGSIFAILQDTLKPIPGSFTPTAFLKCAHSSNDGNNWSIVNNNYFPTNDWPVGIAVNSSGTLFAARSKFGAGATGGVDVSINQGSSWFSLNTGLPNTKMKALTIGFNNFVYATTDSVSPSLQGNVYYYDGTAWIASNLQGAPVTTICFDQTAAVMYAGTQSGSTGKIYKSTDGMNWNQLVGYPGNSFSKLQLGVAGDLFVASFSNGIFHSADGITWNTLLVTGIPNVSTLHHMAIDNSNNIFLTDWDGILKSTLTSPSWTRFNNGIICSATNGFTFINNYEMFVASRSGIDYSDDSGSTWSKIDVNGKSVWSVGRNSTTGDLFASMSSTPPYLYKSTANGVQGSWLQCDAGMVGSLITFFDNDNVGNMFYGGGWMRQVFKSATTSGTTWIPNAPLAQSGMPQNTVTTAIAIDKSNPSQFIYTGMESAGVFRSDDLGQTYTSLGLTGGDISGIKVASNGDVWVAQALNQNSGVYKSTDNGNTWSANLLPGVGVVNGLAAPTFDSIFVATTTGVYLIKSNGTQVQQLNGGLAGLSVISLEVGPDNHLYASVSGAGIHRSTQPVVDIVIGLDEADNLFDVDVYPVPAKDKIYFKFKGPEKIYASLLIYNSSGQPVYKNSAIINSEVHIDISQFNTGLYFYKIVEAHGKTLTGKFIIE